MHNAPKSLQQLAADAITIQDASNLSGLVYSWAEAMDELREVMPTASTETINRHPINKLWAYKVYSLACGEPLDSAHADQVFGEAYQWCKDHAG